MQGFPLAKCIEHCVNKQYEFFYKFTGRTAQNRLHKYMGRGWQCLTEVPRNYYAVLSRNRQATCRPQAQ